MSIMVEYDLPEWCEGCNELSTVKRYVGDIDFPHYNLSYQVNINHFADVSKMVGGCPINYTRR